MSDKACRDCRFYTGGSMGECRFNPPVIYVNKGDVVCTTWPLAHYRDWCGKFRRKADMPE